MKTKEYRKLKRSIKKCLKSKYKQIKQKHLRNIRLLIQTETGINDFWEIIKNYKNIIEEHSRSKFKYYILLHVTLQDGHIFSIVGAGINHLLFNTESFNTYNYNELGNDHFCITNQIYDKYLNAKITFHITNRFIFGSFDIGIYDILSVLESNIDSIFRFSSEILDLLDNIILLMEIGFPYMIIKYKTTPFTELLTICIKESFHQYQLTADLIGYMLLFQPPEIIEGHRQRFCKVHNDLFKIYTKSKQSSNITIDIPVLSHNLPILKSSNLSQSTFNMASNTNELSRNPAATAPPCDELDPYHNYMIKSSSSMPSLYFQ